ncbi:MAG: sugar phosphate nucleotidyltransferase [Patescibacteria group bacterium]
MKVIILAGGGGTRLWPLSREKAPKQTQKIFGKQTLLKKTFNRLRKGFALRDIYVSCGEKHLKAFKKDLPKLPQRNFILEPFARNTAAAIGLAAVTIHKKYPEEIIIMANADHFIDNEKEYLRTVRVGGRIIRENPGYTGVLGTNPTYPETGLGYIEMGEQKFKIGKDRIFTGRRFIEKPDLKTAEKYLKKWNYLWNPAYFIWQVDHLLDLFKKYLPAHYRILKKIEKSIGTKEEKKVKYREFKKIKTTLPSGKAASIDYGIMEKIGGKMLVIPGQFSFTDVGHWRSVKEILSETAEDNVILGEHIGHQTKGCLIYNLSKKLVATAGVENMIVVNTKDALLICPRAKAQEVKNIVEMLKKKKKGKYL